MDLQTFLLLHKQILLFKWSVYHFLSIRCYSWSLFMNKAQGNVHLEYCECGNKFLNNRHTIPSCIPDRHSELAIYVRSSAFVCKFSAFFFKFLIYGLIHCSIINLLISSELFSSFFPLCATDKCEQKYFCLDCLCSILRLLFIFEYCRGKNRDMTT